MSKNLVIIGLVVLSVTENKQNPSSSLYKSIDYLEKIVHKLKWLQKYCIKKLINFVCVK